MQSTKLLVPLVISLALMALEGAGCQKETSPEPSGKPEAKTGSGVTVGAEAPEFALKSLSGEIVKLSNLRGKVVIIDFWATWCPPCRREIPDFIELFSKYSGRGVAILGISVDREGEKALKPFVEKYRINYPILLADRAVEGAYGGIDAIPTTFVIDQKGVVRKKYVGLQAGSVFENDITSLLLPEKR